MEKNSIPNKNRSEYNEFINNAKEFFERGEIKKAIEYVESALILYPNDNTAQELYIDYKKKKPEILKANKIKNQTILKDIAQSERELKEKQKCEGIAAKQRIPLNIFIHKYKPNICIKCGKETKFGRQYTLMLGELTEVSAHPVWGNINNCKYIPRGEIFPFLCYKCAITGNSAYMALCGEFRKNWEWPKNITIIVDKVNNDVVAPSLLPDPGYKKEGN